MAFGGLIITSKGRNALVNAQLSGTLELSYIAIGDGKYTGSFNDILKLKNELFTLDIGKAEIDGDNCIIEADLSNSNLSQGYYLREIGIYAKADGKDILYVYDNAGDDAEYIPNDEGAVSVEKRLRFTLNIGNVSNVTLSTQSVLYALQSDFENHEDDNEIHVTQKKQDLWDAKAEDKLVTQLERGLLSPEDKKKLDNIISTSKQAAQTFTVNIGDLQSTIDSLPKLLNYDVTINVNAGTYSGTITIQGFYGSGWIYIYGANSTSATTHNVEKVIVEYNSLTFMQLRGLNATNTTGYSFYSYHNLGYLVFSGCNAFGGSNTDELNYGIYHGGNSLTYASQCDIWNKYYAFASSFGGLLSIYNVKGNNNNYIFFSTNSGTLKIRKEGTITGNVLFLKSLGGSITNLDTIIGDIDGNSGGLNNYTISTDTFNPSVLLANLPNYSTVGIYTKTACASIFGSNGGEFNGVYQKISDTFGYVHGILTSYENYIACVRFVTTRFLSGDWVDMCNTEDYLPKSGGTMTGQLCMNDKQLRLGTENTAGVIEQHGGGGLRFIGRGGSDVNYSIIFGCYGNTSIEPYVSGNLSLGNSGKLWSALYAQTGSITTSDRTYKKEINHLNLNLMKKFILGLIPSSYILTDGESGRTHYGFVAQDIEELMQELKIDSMEFAGFIKSPKTIQKKITEFVDETDIDEDGNEITVQREVETEADEIVEGEYVYALRYEEFIAPAITVLQDHEERIQELESKNKEKDILIEKMLSRIEALENK